MDAYMYFLSLALTLSSLVVCSKSDCMLKFGITTKNCRVEYEEQLELALSTSDHNKARRYNCSGMTSQFNCLQSSLHIFHECDLVKPLLLHLLNSTKVEREDMCKEPERLVCDPEMDENCRGNKSVEGASSGVTTLIFSTFVILAASNWCLARNLLWC